MAGEARCWPARAIGQAQTLRLRAQGVFTSATETLSTSAPLRGDAVVDFTRRCWGSLWRRAREFEPLTASSKLALKKRDAPLRAGSSRRRNPATDSRPVRRAA